jgi:hypothetical protein
MASSWALQKGAPARNYQVALARAGLGQRQQFRQVILEDEPELALSRRPRPLGRQALTQALVANLGDQVVNGGQGVLSG